MKKLIVLMIAVIMVISVTACGKSGGEEAKEWSREGTFEDENGNTLTISKSELEGPEYEGWYVGLITEEGLKGWYIKQDGATLHGDIIGDLDGDEKDDGEMIVTVSEEGEDGIKLEVEGGETYHFGPLKEEHKAKYVARINTDGLGEIAYAEEGQEPEFDDEYPAQSTQLNVAEPTTYVLAARPDEGYKFVKWTKDGEDYSEEDKITVTVDADVEYRAVFEPEE